MNHETMVEMLKIDLGITTNVYDIRLNQLLDVATEEIKREGATNLTPSSDIRDADLVIRYAEYLWRKRDTMEAMPRMLRWALNNRVFGEKMG